MKKLLKEFGDFIKKGNVLDLAVAVVIGGAFTAIVNSLVEYIINPLIGMICGGMCCIVVCECVNRLTN